MVLPFSNPLSASCLSTQLKTASWVSTSINRRVLEIVEWSGGDSLSFNPKNSRNASESAARQAIPRFRSNPSK